MPLTHDFSHWFTFFSQWLHESQVRRQYGELEPDLLLNFMEVGVFEKLVDDNRLRSYPILSGSRYEMVMHCLAFLDHPGNPDQTSYSQLARIVLVWNQLPLLVLFNTSMPNPRPQDVSLVLDMATLAARTYVLPQSTDEVRATKRWKVISGFLVFLGYSLLLNDKAA